MSSILINYQGCLPDSLDRELRVMTSNFDNKLGTLSDGTKVAVKRLNGFGQVKKSFLAKVKTIGSIHHVNWLVW
ncbi:hypothetical protein ACSBR2_027222 [Camellia fascicularis]